MLYKTLPKILFLDIETVSFYASYAEMNEEWKALWWKKAAYWLKGVPENEMESAVENLYPEKAGIYAEFGKIVCISLGLVTVGKDELKSLRLRSIYGKDEKPLLEDFSALLNKYYPDPGQYYLCGHNIKEFDIPYIARRMIVNDMKLPAMLDISGKKPWETTYLLDTMEQWKFGDYKHYTSLRLLAHILGIPSPKDDIDGSEVGEVFWREGNLARIKEYCEKDVKTTVQVFLRLNGMGSISED